MKELCKQKNFFQQKLCIDYTYSSNGKEELKNIQKMIHAEKSDIFDVLQYISFSQKTTSRKERIEKNSDRKKF